MPRIFSKLFTSVAYGAIILKPGENSITQAEADTLAEDKNFQAHWAHGSYTGADDPVPVAAIEPEPVTAVDPRARVNGETKKAYDARMKALDDAEAASVADANFIATFFSASEADQATLYGAANERERAVVDAARGTPPGGA